MSHRERHRSTIVLGAMVAGVPGHGGATWAVLQYALGLRRLGHRVLVVESISPLSVAPRGASIAASCNAAYAEASMAAVGLAGSWSLVEEGSTATAGMPYEDVLEVVAEADLLVNVAGALRDQEILGRIPIRLYVDVDPGFTQVWDQSYGVDLGLAAHTHFATYGRSLAEGLGPVPDCGRRWIGAVPPVVLEHWATPLPSPSPASGAGAGTSWTTVANWRSHGTVEHGGVTYGPKAHSWRQLFALPRLVDERFTVALGIDDAEVDDVAALRANGWELVDPRVVAASPGDYRRFVASSKAELAVAKAGYVTASTGWFSDRSACYLASGRPVVAQDTGLSRHLPTGEGLVTFVDVDEAAEAVCRVSRDYLRHRAAAAKLAREVFDSDRVLGDLLGAVGVTA